MQDCVRIREVPCQDNLTGFLWLSSVSLGKFWDSTSNMPRLLPHKSFPIHYSPFILSACIIGRLVIRETSLCKQTTKKTHIVRFLPGLFIANTGPVTAVSLHLYCVMSQSSDILMHFTIPLTCSFCCVILLIQIRSAFLRTLICVGFGVPVGCR